MFEKFNVEQLECLEAALTARAKELRKQEARDGDPEGHITDALTVTHDLRFRVQRELIGLPLPT